MKKIFLICLLLSLIFSCASDDLSPGDGLIKIEEDGKKWRGLEVDGSFDAQISDTWILTIWKDGNRKSLTEFVAFSNIPARKGIHPIVGTLSTREPVGEILSTYGTLNHDLPVDSYSLKESPDNFFELTSFDPISNEEETISFSSKEYKVIVK